MGADDSDINTFALKKRFNTVLQINV